MKRIAVVALIAVLGAGPAVAQSAPLPFEIESRMAEDGVCICNEDYTKCLCCETVLTPPFVACDIVANGEDVTDESSLYLTMHPDGTATVRIRPVLQIK